MLPENPSFERTALNRVTFGARDVEVANTKTIGWEAYVEDQLNPPAGDDDALANHITGQTMRIHYPANESEEADKGWDEVEEDRPLNYLKADAPTLWQVQRDAQESRTSFEEVTRMMQETTVATWMRASHAEYQIREFMADFWNNHFNVSQEDDKFGTGMVLSYDRDHIRPYVFGNFRDMLEANATSTSMLLYLDGANSQADHPNENYGRELLELHTLGKESYLGVVPPLNAYDSGKGVNAPGFFDQDVINAARAFSGWTVKDTEMLQHYQGISDVEDTGEFIYNPEQHNTSASQFLGVDLKDMNEDMEQGRAILDIAAYHPQTAEFICNKICVRIFGDNPPKEVVQRAKDAWLANKEQNNQLAQVMRAILLDGPEIGEGSADKLRRPFERIVAYMRATDMVVNAHQAMHWAQRELVDGIYIWPTPDGRPDNSAYWMSSNALLKTLNFSLRLTGGRWTETSFYDQTPSESLGSATQIVEYWVERLVGYELSAETTDALLTDASTSFDGVMEALNNKNDPERIESALGRLTAMIAATEEFSYR